MTENERIQRVPSTAREAAKRPGPYDRAAAKREALFTIVGQVMFDATTDELGGRND